MLCGLPGAGKTTLAKELESERQVIRFCPDEWIAMLLATPTDKVERERLRDPVESLLFQTALQLCKLGSTVVLENGFWVRSERDLYRERVQKQGIFVELHYKSASFETLWQRVDTRNKSNPLDPFVISKEELTKWHTLFEHPDSDELKLFDSTYIQDF